MHNNIYKIFSGSVMLAMSALPMGAVKAYPGLINALQPDGTSLNIYLEGDKFSNCAYSEDGYLLMADEAGFYTYAVFNDAGEPVTSGLKARNLSERTERDHMIIASIDKENLISTFKKRTLEKKKAPMKNPGLSSNSFPSKGEHKSIAILVEFPDRQFTIENPKEHYLRMLNEENYNENNCIGSIRDYFIENSNGAFTPYFDVYGPVMMAHDYAYYGREEDALAYQMVIEACNAIDDDVDFTQYDCNNDGFIDNVYIYYAGYGQADGGGYNTVWPHSWDIAYGTYEKFFYDGVQLNHYACSNELRKSNDTPDGIGPFLHEFSHVMGLPDLYCTDYSEAFTPGAWSILDQGSYNNKSCRPPYYSGYERYALEWIEPEIINKSGEYTLPPLGSSNKAFYVPTDNENEFFILENRQFERWDYYIPWHGMLVWHIDFDQDIWDDNIVNNDANHQYVDLVEADNLQTSNTRVSDCFPGMSNITEFTATTKPAFVSWSGTPTFVNIYDIKESDEGIITFRVEFDEEGAGIQGITNDEFMTIYGNLIQCKGSYLNIYDISGKMIASLKKEDSISLPKGFFIASSEKESRKIILK